MSNPIISLTTLATVLLIAICTFAPHAAEARRAFFVFGDSLVDSGNNNFLATTARADFPPYGLDYPGHQPTGRFSNGLNFPDLIAEAIGLEHPVAYLDPQHDGEKLLNGANFASAGVGILNETGIQFANIIRISEQFQLFQDYQSRVRDMIGEDQTQELVNGALFLVTLGGNDFVNNYFLPPAAYRRQQFSLPEYCIFLVSEFKKILTRLNGLGAKRVVVTGVGPLGCVPAELALSLSMNGECAAGPQTASQIFNPLLFKMLQDLNSQLGSQVFIGANAFDMNMGLISDPKNFGFKTSKVACCGQGIYNGLGLCTAFSNLCQNRDEYAFWDPFHPTERLLRLLVNELMTGSTKYMNPMNLSTIMALDSNN